MSEEKHVYKAISAMIETLSHDGISKARRNEQQGFAFRGIDDVYNAISSGLAKHRLIIIPRMVERVCEARTTAKGGVMYSVTVCAEFDFVSAVDGSCHTCRMYGEAMDSGDKATNKAMSAAYKYACIQTLCIPTEAESPDADQTTPPATVLKPKKQPPPSDEQRAAAGIDTGGHPVGSDAAAQHVAAQKLKAAPASFDMLTHFGDMKKALGAQEYYRILGLHGFEKSNEIRDLNKAREVYKMMAARKVELDVEVAKNA